MGYDLTEQDIRMTALMHAVDVSKASSTDTTGTMVLFIASQFENYIKNGYNATKEERRNDSISKPSS